LVSVSMGDQFSLPRDGRRASRIQLLFSLDEANSQRFTCNGMMVCLDRMKVVRKLFNSRRV